MESGIKNNQKIVMVCAPAKAGKDTLYPLLKRDLTNQLGGIWHQHAFADKLKEDLEIKIKKKYGVSVWDDSKKHIFRGDLIKYGEQRRAETNNRYLVDHFLKTYKSYCNYVISDNRFINEIFDLQEYFGKSSIIPIYIERVFTMKSGLTMVSEPTIPQEIYQYEMIKEVAKVHRVPWVTGLFWKIKLKNHYFDFGNSHKV